MASHIHPRVARSTVVTLRSSLLKPASSPFSTTVKASRSRTSIQPTHPSISARIPPQAYIAPSTSTLRHASSSASTANPTSTSEETLTWDRFFELRRKRRYGNTVASAITAGAAVTAFTPVIASQDIDGWAAQISGLDPIVVLGITTFAVAAGGWLCGPTFGNGIFRVWAGRRGWNQAIAEKEKSFFARVKRYRADPSSSSPQNPIPDYYGEKIASVKDYRRWLKDQRAFNLKKNKNMINTTLFGSILRR